MDREETTQLEIPDRYTDLVWKQTFSTKTTTGILTLVILVLVILFAAIIAAAAFQLATMLPTNELIILLAILGAMIALLLGIITGRAITTTSRKITISGQNDGTELSTEERDSTGSPESQ